MSDREFLDCKNLACPMPIVKVSRAMKEMSDGSELEVEASDPAFRADIEAWANRMGFSLVEFDDGPVKRAVIRKDAA